jgi:hypothetical protein
MQAKFRIQAPPDATPLQPTTTMPQPLGTPTTPALQMPPSPPEGIPPAHLGDWYLQRASPVKLCIGVAPVPATAAVPGTCP